MKPIPLIERLIRNSSRKGEIVLDTFGGSGTTLLASEKLERKCRMVEYDPKYVDVIIERWEQLSGGKAVLNAPREMLIEKTDLEEETVDEVLRILKSEFEEEENH